MFRKKEPWKLVVLEHDKASERIREFFEQIWTDGIIPIKIATNTEETKENLMDKMHRSIGALELVGVDISKEKILTLYGDGDSHHYTYGLCYFIAPKKSKNYMYVHTDRHTDAAAPLCGLLDCGAFVENILQEPKAKDIMLLGTEKGTNDWNRKLLNQETLMSWNAKKELKKALREKRQKDVYTSFDLDVLKTIEILTSFDQGKLELEHVLNIIKTIKEEKNIISADILGYHKGMLKSLEPVSLLTYATIAAEITGKDTYEVRGLRKYFRRVVRPSSDEFEKLTEQLRI